MRSSMANCSLEFAGASESPILLAECGCITATADNGLGQVSQVGAAKVGRR